MLYSQATSLATGRTTSIASPSAAGRHVRHWNAFLLRWSGPIPVSLPPATRLDWPSAAKQSRAKVVIGLNNARRVGRPPGRVSPKNRFQRTPRMPSRTSTNESRASRLPRNIKEVSTPIRRWMLSMPSRNFSTLRGENLTYEDIKIFNDVRCGH
ncbi:hypothetical protein EVAR_67342_1 [Eumeta japonica]|uniref:Uncharacterized protein n=1 Tax=Eumeta variegata TaxID=151549 RepID=A0A4C2A2F4_EUMVA|nr:hypothetical protein EVAR_67342_1 [Eumeta japonica]